MGQVEEMAKGEKAAVYRRRISRKKALEVLEYISEVEQGAVSSVNSFAEDDPSVEAVTAVCVSELKYWTEKNVETRMENVTRPTIEYRRRCETRIFRNFARACGTKMMVACFEVIFAMSLRPAENRAILRNVEWVSTKNRPAGRSILWSIGCKVSMFQQFRRLIQGNGD